MTDQLLIPLPSRLSAAKLLDSGQPLIATGACTTLGEIGRNGPLPLPCDDRDKKVDGTSKLAIVDNLIGKVKASKTNSKVSDHCAAFHINIDIKFRETF